MERISLSVFELTASRPKILKDVIRNNLILYPAENNLVILAGHGLGWKGALEDYAIGKMYIEQGRFSLPPGDDGSHLKYCYDRAIKAINEKRLQNRMAKDSINDGNKSKINIIAFDACLMGNIEAINHFKDLSEIIVTSEDVF
ncbi:MAG: clostripain-related cysteine peptidase, partial [Methanothrix soehngenii]|uniref:clostripain-related cysteine peptidase n=1 Tax=Methanothrix soehngenii TaxID=2223 RepID=UPI0031412EB8